MTVDAEMSQKPPTDVHVLRENQYHWFVYGDQTRAPFRRTSRPQDSGYSMHSPRFRLTLSRPKGVPYSVMMMLGVSGTSIGT